MKDDIDLPRKPMLLIAALQGIWLMLLYQATDAGSWPSENPVWSFPLWTLGLATPVLLLLSLDKGNTRSVALHVGAFSAVLAVLAAYVGWQAEPFGEFPVAGMAFAFGLTVALACFKALMYLQQRAAGMAMRYDVLFRYSWRNFLTLSLSLLLTCVFWLILQLWAALFHVIGIEFFKNLFEMEWFTIPVLAITHGIGVIVFRNLTGVIDGITRLLQGLMKLLLPLVLLIAVIFIAVLPFVGLDALWATRRGTSLLLWLLALILFFVNAVYQDGRGERPYPDFVHRALWVALLTMPIVSALSFYGLYLRLEQHGWTVMRSWAFVVWLLLSLFAVGYTIAVLRQRDRWTAGLARVNTLMGLVVLTIMLLANSPLLDFRKIAVASQLGRVESGQQTLEDLDYQYFHRMLARPGYLAAEAIKADIGDSDPGLLSLIERRAPVGAPRPMDGEEFWASMTYRPAGLTVPGGLRERIDIDIDATHYYRETTPILTQADLDDDGDYEYALIVAGEDYLRSMSLYYRENGDWRRANLTFSRGTQYRQSVLDTIRQGEVATSTPRFKQLRIGDYVFTAEEP